MNRGGKEARKSSGSVSPPPSPHTTPVKPRPAEMPKESGDVSQVNSNVSQAQAQARRSSWDEAQELMKDRNKPMLDIKLNATDTGSAKEMAGLFSHDEVRRLGMRFRKLDKDSSGSLSLDEFMNIPELRENPLVQRVVEIFDVDRNGEVDFKEFIEGISHFTVTGNTDKRMRFAFRIYDIDNDGYISNGELYRVMKLMVGPSMVDTQLQHMVDTTILLGDKDGDGKISFQEFSDLVNNASGIHKKMVVEGI